MTTLSFLLSVVNILATCSALGVVHLYFLRDEVDYEEWKKREMKKRGIDWLRIHECLTTGFQSRICDVHLPGILRCSDMTCGFKPMSYILDLIDKGVKSLDVAIYMIDSDGVSKAVIAAHRRGVQVRIICDSDLSFGSLSTINELKSSGIVVRQKMSEHIMHHKFFIIDKEVLATGSMNFTRTALLTNWENIIISSAPSLVDQFADHFQELWEDFQRSPPA